MPENKPAGRELLGRFRRALKATIRSRLARNAAKLGAAGTVGLVLALLQSILVARWLGPRNFGMAALILSFPALVFTFFDPQAREAVVKFLGEFIATDQPRKALAVPKMAYAVDGVLAVAGLAVVAVAAPWAADHLLGVGGYAGLLIFVAAAQMTVAPAETSRAVLTTFGRFTTLAWSQSCTILVRFVLVVAAVGAGGGVEGFVLATGTGTVVDSLVVAWLAHRAIRRSLGAPWWHGRRADVAGRLREMGGFLAYTDLTSLVAVFVKQADIVILGWIRGPVEAGYYRLARSLTAPVTSGTIALQAVLYPQVAHLAAAPDGVRVMSRVRLWFLRAGVPLAVVSLVAIPFVPRVIDVVAGPDYLGATSATRWLLLGSALVLACFWLRPVLLATGEVRFMLASSMALGAATVAGFFILSGPFGAAGVAAARTLVAGIGGTAAGVLWLWRLDLSGRMMGGGPAEVPALELELEATLAGDATSSDASGPYKGVAV